MSPCQYAFLGLSMLLACARPRAQPAPAAPDLSHAASADQRARSAERPSRYFAIECFDVYAECAPFRDLPALSADHTRVAIADTGPEDARDEFVLSVRVLDVASGKDARALPILTHEDRSSGVDPDTGELSPELQQTVRARIRAAEQMLADGGFTALAPLGTVHRSQAAAGIPEVSATFDGRVLTIREHDRVRWQRPIGRSPAQPLGQGDRCGRFPVAEISLWLDRAAGVVLARVAYTTSDMCPIADDYLVWR